MKRTYGKFKTVLLALLALTAVLCVTFASVAVADTTTVAQHGPITVETNARKLTVSIDATKLDELTSEEVKGAGDDIISQLKDIVVEQIMSSEAVGISAISNTLPLDAGEESVLGRYADKLKEKLREEGQLDKYINGEYDLLIKQAVAEYMDEHEDVDSETVQKMMDEVNSIVEDVIVEEAVKAKDPDLAGDELEQRKNEVKEQLARGNTSVLDSYAETYDKSQQKQEELADTVTDIVENGAPALGVDDILSALESLKVNGYTVLTEESGWDISGVKGLLFDLLDKFRAIDTEFVFDFDVEAVFGFGTAQFQLTLQVTNYDNSTLQSVINYVKEHFDFSHENGVWTVNVKVPEGVLNVLNYLPDDLLNDIFEASSQSISGIKEVIDGYSAEDMMTALKGIEYHKIFESVLNHKNGVVNFIVERSYDIVTKIAQKQNVAEVKELLKGYGISLSTRWDSVLGKVLDKLHELKADTWQQSEYVDFLKSEECTAAIVDVLNQVGGESVRNALSSVLDEIYDIIPADIKDCVPTELFENKWLVWSGNVDVEGKNFDSLLGKVFRRLSGLLGVDQVKIDQIINWIDENINYQDVSLSFGLQLPNVGKVTYRYNDASVTGLVLNGTEVSRFAPTEGKDGKTILAWTADKTTAAETVNGDATYYAVTEFDAVLSVDRIEGENGEYVKEYNGNDVVLTAYITSGEGNDGHCTYQWYKNDRALDGATESSYSFGNVADSGDYYCVVTSEITGHFATSDTVTVEINKKIVTITDAWEYTSPLAYTGGELKVDLTETAKETLNRELGVGKWTISGNTATASGSYKAKVEITDTTLAANYALNIAELTWEITDNVPVDPNGERGKVFTAVDANGDPLVIDGTTVTVKDVNGSVNKNYRLTGAPANDYRISYFEDVLRSNNKNVNAAIIQILSLRFTDASDKEVSVNGVFEVTLTNNDKFGSVAQSDIILIHIHQSRRVLVDATVANGKVTFTVNNFSDFALLSNAAVGAGEEETDAWWIWLLLAIIIILNIVIILLLLLRRKEAEQTADEQTETPAEEVVATETEQPEQTEVVAEPEQQQDEPLVPFVVTEGTVLDRSFTARLSQAEDALKELYSAVKNELLSYKKIRSRVSWKFDSFYKGRKKCVILQIRGKKLNMYIALNAADLAPKYHAKDVSEKARFSSVPTLVKISGKRSLLYAKQLIALLMSNLGVERDKEQNVNYKLRRKATQTLINEGYIKVKPAKGRFAAAARAQEQPQQEEPAPAAEETPTEPAEETVQTENAEQTTEENNPAPAEDTNNGDDNK